MKPATSTFFLALTLILLFTKPSLSSRAIVDDTDTVVYDAKGNPLQKNAFYHITPPGRGANFGGPVVLSDPIGYNKTCVADVLQWPFELLPPGPPFTFTPVDHVNEDVIKLGYPVAIQSPTENPCKGASSTVWKVSSRIGVYAQIITTGGDFNTPSSCLTIRRPRAPRFSNSYTFEYCPSLCGEGGVEICYPVGIYEFIKDSRHLSPDTGLHLPAFEFVLSKVIEPAVISEVI